MSSTLCKYCGLASFLPLVWVVWTAKAVETSSGDDDVLVWIKSSFHQDQDGIRTFRVSDFFVKKNIALTNSPWLPGQGPIPMQLGRQAQRVNVLLQEQNTNAAQISLESISITPAIKPTNQSIAEFRFSNRLKTELRTKPTWIVMLLDGTIATERPHVNTMSHSRPGLESSGPVERGMVDEEQVFGPPINGVTHGDPNAPHKSEFEIPELQWVAVAGDNYPADLCAQEALAISYLKRENPNIQALTLEAIVLRHYIPMEAIVAKRLNVPDHLNHWQVTFHFRETATDSQYHLPVLLDNRILGFTEFSRKTGK